MTTVQKIVPVPTMLTADTDGDTVASELTDPLAAWSEQIAKAASDWNPCMTEMTGKETMRDSDVDTESESETETEYETDTDASSSSSSYNSSSEGYGRDEDRPRYQPSLRKKQSMSRRKRHEAGEEDFDPMQAVFDFVGWLLEPSIGSDDEDWSNALTASDQDLLNRHILRKEGRQVAAQLDHESNLAHAKKPNLLLNERHIESGRHLRSDHGSTYHDHVVVATEALALCDLEADTKTIPFTIRNHLVGIVHHVGPEAKALGLKQGMRVASIVSSEYNSKYVSMPVDHLYVVPKALDASEMAALFAYYLPAFQALHHGRTRPYRYSRNCLKGRKVLVTGGNRLEAQAVLRLARLAGATELYATAPHDYHSALASIDGVTMLEDFPKGEWLYAVRGRMDLVIDLEFPKGLKTVRKALAKKGRLVCVPSKKAPVLSSMYEQYRVSSVKRASLFDFTESISSGLEETHEDVMFLLKHLTKRNIRPTIDRFIQLGDVPSIFDKIQGCPLTGAVVCEPRKEL